MGSPMFPPDEEPVEPLWEVSWVRSGETQHIHSAVVARQNKFASADYAYVEFREHERVILRLAIPKNVELGTAIGPLHKILKVIDQQPPIGHRGIAVAVGDNGPKQSRARLVPVGRDAHEAARHS